MNTTDRCCNGVGDSIPRRLEEESRAPSTPFGTVYRWAVGSIGVDNIGGVRERLPGGGTVEKSRCWPRATKHQRPASAPPTNSVELPHLTSNPPPAT